MSTALTMRAANFGRRPSLALGLGLLILAAAFLAARAGRVS